jgi:hypothetical protein
MYVKTVLFHLGLTIMVATTFQAAAQSNALPSGRLAGVENLAIDVQISLYTDPTDPTYPSGDGDGNTQGFIPSEQDRYEIILQYFAAAVFEITGGEHRVRNVVINTNGIRSDVSDVVWVREGQPNINLTGSGAPHHGRVLSLDL